MPRKYSMDIRSEAAALRRRRLIDATVEVLAEVGADRLTMDMVAERADAATRTIYNYFPTRQDLLSAVGQAVAFAFVMTNHVSWRVLREELALTQEQAVETTVTGIEAGLFR